jgi:hypothetical protein
MQHSQVFQYAVHVPRLRRRNLLPIEYLSCADDSASGIRGRNATSRIGAAAAATAAGPRQKAGHQKGLRKNRSDPMFILFLRSKGICLQSFHAARAETI